MSKRTRKHTVHANKDHQGGMNLANRQLWGVGIAVLVILAVVVFMLVQQGDDDEASTTASVTDGNNVPSEISVDQAAALREQGAYILDVREQSEWDEFHVPDSHLIPLGELASRLDEVPQDQQIVVVCRSGNRSQQGRDILEAAGFTQVTSMAGGLTEWRSEGYPVE